MCNPFQKEYNRLTPRFKNCKYESGKFESIKGCIPNKHGVYILRAPYLLGRAKGSSDIIYIGKAGEMRNGELTEQGIQGRCYNPTRPELQTFIRRKIEELYPNEEFIFEYYVTNQNEIPEDIEQKLLQAYLQTFCELPPANRNLKTKYL